mgnify:CR=1 FL=1|tara:strand:+ start:190 stop:399 length:210 start_codon:yes stop_codon:yes gene_type:complete
MGNLSIGIIAIILGGLLGLILFIIDKTIISPNKISFKPATHSDIVLNNLIKRVDNLENYIKMIEKKGEI